MNTCNGKCHVFPMTTFGQQIVDLMCLQFESRLCNIQDRLICLQGNDIHTLTYCHIKYNHRINKHRQLQTQA